MLHFYFAGIIVYGYTFWKKTSDKPRRLEIVKKIILVSLVVLNLLYFIFRISAYGHAPITTMFEIMSLMSFGIVLTYLYIELKTKETDTGFFILVIAGLLEVISFSFIEELKEINPVLKTWVLGIHVSAAIIGYSGIILSGIYGFLYLRLYRKIKKNQVDSFFKKLPSLKLLSSLTRSAISFGFIFFTFTIVQGFVWLPKAIDNFSYLDPKLISSTIIWLLYLGGYIGIITKRFKINTLMKLAFAGSVFSVLSMMFVNIFLKSFHNFY